jgi:Tfp pilus assembly protein PilV
MWRSSKARDRRGGFMLAEVLVAVTVATILVLALIRFLAVTRMHIAQIQDRLEIWMVGRTLIDRLPSEALLQSDTRTGRVGRFRWQIEVAPLARSDLSMTVLARSAKSDFIKTQMSSAGSTSPGALQGAGPTTAQQQVSANNISSSQTAKATHEWTTYRVTVKVEDASGARYASETIRIGHNASD